MRTTIAVGVALSCATGGDAAILDELLAGAGMTATAFMDTHWQRAPLYASAAEVVANDDAGAEPSWRQDLLTSDQVFSALSDVRASAACREAELVVSDRTVKRGAESEADSAGDGECALSGLNAGALRRSAATLLLPHVDDLFESLHNFSCSVQRFLGGIPTGMNAYLSPPPRKLETIPEAVEGAAKAQRGFLMHRDGHDLFVIQTEGSKVWEICEPRNVLSRLVAKGQHYSPGFSPDEAEYSYSERRLTKGDALYLPRGTLHAPRIEAESSEGSLHISMGVDVRHFRYVDVLLAHTRSEALVEALAGTADASGGLDGCNETPAIRCVAFELEEKEGGGGDEQWTWARLLGEMCETLPDLQANQGGLLSYMARKSFPMHVLNQVPAPERAVDEYMEFVEALKEGCGDLLGNSARTLVQAKGGSVEKARAVEAIVRQHCPQIIASTFTRAAYESVIAETMHRAGQRMLGRRCDLPPWHKWDM